MIKLIRSIVVRAHHETQSYRDRSKVPPSSLSQARTVSSCERQRPEASYAPRVVDQAPPSYGAGHWHEGVHAGHVDTIGGMAIVPVRVARGDETCHGSRETPAEN